MMKRYELFPEIKPFRTGTLKVSTIHTLFYEEVGKPDGRPALFLHGGPGMCLSFGDIANGSSLP